MKAQLGRSPDAGDAVCLANFRTMKDADLAGPAPGAAGDANADDLCRDIDDGVDNLYLRDGHDLYRDLR